MQQLTDANQRELYTPKQVGIILGVKTETVHAWLSRKEMRALKVGHRRFISEQNIKEFYESRKSGDYIDYTYAHGPAK